MLSQTYGLENSYPCDTTTSISTPFFVKDILNMPSDSEFIDTFNQSKECGHFEEHPSFHYQNWDNSINHYGSYDHYNYNNYVHVKLESAYERFEGPNHYSEQINQANNFCVGYQEVRESEFNKAESPSKTFPFGIYLYNSFDK